MSIVGNPCAAAGAAPKTNADIASPTPAARAVILLFRFMIFLPHSKDGAVYVDEIRHARPLLARIDPHQVFGVKRESADAKFVVVAQLPRYVV